VKINQYCSVCKKHLDMEVIPTDDVGDDGVIWLRCPECQGFLPKYSGKPQDLDPATAAPASARAPREVEPGQIAGPDRVAEADPLLDEAAPDVDEDDRAEPDDAPAAPREPVAEYAAMLAQADLTRAKPYRPTAEFAVGDVIHHLANDDVGIVVAKEELPGGRRAVKVYFEETGVVRLIEQASDRP